VLSEGLFDFDQYSVSRSEPATHMSGKPTLRRLTDLRIAEAQAFTDPALEPDK
jgi:hypothetical protein